MLQEWILVLAGQLFGGAILNENDCLLGCVL